MSKASAILLCPTVALRTLPDQERDVLRRFFTEHVRGMDRKHDTRWRRFVRDLFNAEPGEGFQLYRAEERGGAYHRMHRAVLTRLFESQDRFRHPDKLHDWIKVGGGFVTWEPGKDSKPVAIPRSTAFDVCSEDEMREAHAAMVDFLHTDFATRRLWPHLKAPARQEMLDTILNEKEQVR